MIVLIGKRWQYFGNGCHTSTLHNDLPNFFYSKIWVTVIKFHTHVFYREKSKKCSKSLMQFSSLMLFIRDTKCLNFWATFFNILIRGLKDVEDIEVMLNRYIFTHSSKYICQNILIIFLLLLFQFHDWVFLFVHTLLVVLL